MSLPAELTNVVPLKAIPEKDLDVVLTTKFMFWVANLLSIKADNEENVLNALPAIKKHFWSLGMKEVVQAFTMYADGELSIQPKSNYFDRVLVGQIFQEYRKQKRTKHVKKDIDEEKRIQDYLDVLNWFEWYKENKKTPEAIVWVYDYLDERLDLGFTVKDKKILMKLGADQKLTKEEAIRKSKRVLLGRYFDRLITKNQNLKDLL